MKVKVGINGFGRIGRQVFKAINELHGDELEVVAVNDLFDVKTNAHLFKYDSNYGIYDGTVEVKGDELVIDGKTVKVFAERNPGDLPWKDLGVEIVIESTGIFRDAIGDPNGKPGANVHINKGGAKKVIISAPAKNEDLTIVLGVNDDKYDPSKHHILSNASCTTNCLAPVCKVLLDHFGIEKGIMTTTHAYTGDQSLLDFPHKDLRRARAAALSMIPTTTGAAKAVSLVLPELEGKLSGMAIRVPTPNVSIVDLTVQLSKHATVDEINNVMEEAAETNLKGILGFCKELLVSTDFNGSQASSIVDGPSTMAIGDLVKILSWYDNEFGYSSRMVDLAIYMANS